MGYDSSILLINELVFSLSKLNPEKLEIFKHDHPQIKDELKEGIFAGEDNLVTVEIERKYVRAKTEFALLVLQEISIKSEKAVNQIALKIRRVKKQRLFSQTMILIGSSAVIGTALLDNKPWTIFSASLTLMAALSNLFVEYSERLLSLQNGNIYEAYQKLGEKIFIAKSITKDIEITLLYEGSNENLITLVEQANELCAELNAWLLQLVTQLSDINCTDSNKI